MQYKAVEEQWTICDHQHHQRGCAHFPPVGWSRLSDGLVLFATRMQCHDHHIAPTLFVDIRAQTRKVYSKVQAKFCGSLVLVPPFTFDFSKYKTRAMLELGKHETKAPSSARFSLIIFQWSASQMQTKRKLAVVPSILGRQEGR